MDYETKWEELNARLRSREQLTGNITAALEELEIDQRRNGFIKNDLQSVTRIECQHPSNSELTFHIQINKRRAQRRGGAGITIPPRGERSVNNGCFLCRENIRWQQNQLQVGFHITTRTNAYYVWMNPFPLMPNHVVAAACDHISQAWRVNTDQPERLSLRCILGDFSEIARRLPGYIGFYNGVNAGASIPEHLHFQFFRRPEEKSIFPLELSEFRKLDCANKPEYSVDYPVPVARWSGLVEDVLEHAVVWITNWSADNQNRQAHLTFNVIITSAKHDETIALYFIPRVADRQWWNGDKGIVGGLELLGELVMASDDECALVESGQVDYHFIEQALAAVHTPFWIA
ncbi:MAG: hypothetical protein CBB68_09260 [Rhodospirillaceae bacterium TMED8]|nr:hypothetical protein [Magnetovibrio sp.]OUT50050.1 MAG: hypothetical protein CBB68_09260 [Rhodospirillaceae bacterium TMED8]|tara:strand:- start:52 stop:1089 length:1038 start_codon:yes stop_codon:yes gene_type:complete